MHGYSAAIEWQPEQLDTARDVQRGVMLLNGIKQL